MLPFPSLWIIINPHSSEFKRYRISSEQVHLQFNYNGETIEQGIAENDKKKKVTKMKYSTRSRGWEEVR